MLNVRQKDARVEERGSERVCKLEREREGNEAKAYSWGSM